MHNASRNNFLALIVSAALVMAWLPSSLQADGGKEFVTAHPMPMYPGSVPASNTDRSHRLSKDSLDQVQNFFKAHMRPGDRIEPFSKDDGTGFCIVYAEKAGSRELKASEVCASKKAPKSTPKNQAIEQTIAGAGVALRKVDHPAFDEMAALVTRGLHSEAELRAAEKEYGGVPAGYFRTVQDPGTGKSIDEGDLILKRAQKEAHPNQEQLRAAGKNSKVSAEDKAAAQDVKRQMQELKAKGDIAGMMQLSQSRKDFQGPPANQREALKLAQDDRNRDTWAIWLNCLKELKAAAYVTKMAYSSGVLAE